MAKNVIKGITIEIGGDVTKLDKALTGVNKQSRNLQAELRDVNKLLKLDPKNTELLAQKQEILTEAIEATSEKLDVLKEAEAQVQKQFERGEVSEEQYRALQREVIKCSAELDNLREASKQTDKAMEDLNKSSKLTGEELEKATERADAFKSNLADLGEKAKAAAVAAGAGLAAAATYATKFETDCDKALNTLITQTGAANEEVAGLEETMMSVYKEGFGEDINDVAQAMATVKQQTGLANEELESTTEAALLMRDTFDIDVNEGVPGRHSHDEAVRNIGGRSLQPHGAGRAERIKPKWRSGRSNGGICRLLFGHGIFCGRNVQYDRKRSEKRNISDRLLK